MSGVRIERDGRLAVLRLDKARGNAIDEPLAEALAQAAAELAQDDGVRGVLLASAHPKLFCPGLDLVALAEYDRASMERFMTAFGVTVWALYGLAKPVVAAVSGAAVAGGCILALTRGLPRAAARGADRPERGEGGRAAAVVGDAPAARERAAAGARPHRAPRPQLRGRGGARRRPRGRARARRRLRGRVPRAARGVHGQGPARARHHQGLAARGRARRDDGARARAPAGLPRRLVLARAPRSGSRPRSRASRRRARGPYAQFYAASASASRSTRRRRSSLRPPAIPSARFALATSAFTASQFAASW